MSKFASSIVQVILRLKAEESRPTKGNEILRSCLAQDDMAAGNPLRINGRLYLVRSWCIPKAVHPEGGASRRRGIPMPRR